MWKRLKLLTLVVLTVLLAWMTYPTWRTLITREAPAAAYSEDDRIILYIPDTSQWSGTLEAVGQVRTYGGSTQDYDERLNIISDQGSYDQPTNETVFLVALGRSAHWLDNCQANGIGDQDEFNYVAATAPPGLESLFAEVTDEHPKVIAIRNSLTTCYGPGNLLWSSQDASHTFTTPYIHVIAESHYRSSPAPGPICAGAKFGHGPGIDVEYQFPGDGETSAVKGIDNLRSYGDFYGGGAGAFGPSGQSVIQTLWHDCYTQTGTVYDGGTYLEQEPVKVRTSDPDEAFEIGRNLFFAGVFAAVLGALAIEIFNGTFEVAEGWRERRRTRRDEQEQRPEPEPPDDQPYDPGPRGYL